MDYQYYRHQLQLARRTLDKYNQARAELLRTLPVRHWINMKTHTVKTEYKFEGKWQTVEEIDIQFLELEKLSKLILKGIWENENY